METLNITEKELRQIKYIDDCIRNYKTPKQKIAIELKEKDQAKKRYNKAMEKAREKVRNEPKKIYINHVRSYLRLDEIDEEVIQKEIELFVKQ